MTELEALMARQRRQYDDFRRRARMAAFGSDDPPQHPGEGAADLEPGSDLP